jgi:signal peptidase I
MGDPTGGVGKGRAGVRRFLREWVRPLLVALVVIGSLRSAVADWNDVPTGSMTPTILVGERIFVNKLAYDLRVPFTFLRLARWADPRRGDIVVLFSPADGKRLVKRVVGVPGDRVAMRDDRLFVNGVAARYERVGASGDGASRDGRARRGMLAWEDLAGVRHEVRFDPEVPAERSFSPIVVPPGRYFVMGDNRDRSADSRFFGFVERSSIVGRATTIVASLDPSRHFLPRWRRFFRSLER